ncbi:MAG: chromosome segregation protein SMC [Planctomycetes bacterium]|nr:chromosome segregation protein SMC [Planctomycetota bacterium]
MRLKSLELMGFKSFRDRTEFDFGGGVTGIVGPNGCGKSNVVDAMKWILGEQRPTSLRSSEMQEVIYNGAEGGPNFAQASITILNDRKILPVEYEEVCITRRLYRTGDSEYLINKNPCRLRDIRELLMGTGLGVGGYFVMEQGKIDAILESRPEERRGVFDEAAGISLFKARKKESLRKLDKVDENLVRLHDIFEEVNKQIHSVKIQAGRARRFQELTQELKQKKVTFSLERFHALDAQHEEIVTELEACRTRSNEARQALDSAEAELVRSQESLRERQREIAEAAADRERAEGERERAVERHRFALELLAELDERAKTESDAASALEVRNREAHHALDAAKKKLDECARDVADAQARFESGRELLRAAESRAADCRSSVDRLRARGAELLRERSTLHNRLVELETQHRSLLKQGERLEAKRVEVGAELQSLEGKLEGLQAGEAEAARSAEATAASLQAARDSRESERVARDAAREALNVERERHARKKARFEVLDGIDRRREGVATGPRAILDEAARPSSGLRGVLGLAADVLAVDVAHARAVEAALGERAQCLVVEDDAAALAIIDFSRSHGQSAVAALSIRAPGLGARPALVTARAPDAVIGVAADLVRGKDDERFAAVAERLLGDVAIVRDRSAALELRDAARDARVRLATLDGEVFEPWGAVGSGGALASPGLISRKSELRILTAELERIDSELVRRASELEARDASLRSLEDCVRVLAEDLRAAERRRESFVGERAQIDDRISHLRRDLQTVDAEWREIQGAVTESEAREADGRVALAAVEEGFNATDRDLASAEAQQGDAETSRVATADALSDLRVAVAEALARRDATASGIAREEQALGESEERLAALRRDVEDIRARRERTHSEIGDLEGSLRDLTTKVESLRARDESVRASEVEAQAAVGRAESVVRDTRQSLEDLRENERKLELRENEHALNQKNLVERVQEDLGLDLCDLHRTYEPTPIDAEALGREIEEIKGKIDRLGNVNLDAIQELQALEDRAKFLETQQADLVKAKESLRAVIKQIDETCQERFDTAFRDIRTNFREIFRKLFGGGSADVFLVDEANPLESGVEITAKPPGKEMVTIQLLSGGEKTMTAVALLFAIFRSKPSPFCVLDEVDAALDDANIQRFVTLVREFLHESQFILITHSKKTMSAADILYGITMEQSGVSKKVAVRFRDERPGMNATEAESASTTNGGDGAIAETITVEAN